MIYCYVCRDRFTFPMRSKQFMGDCEICLRQDAPCQNDTDISLFVHFCEPCRLMMELEPLDPWLEDNPSKPRCARCRSRPGVYRIRSSEVLDWSVFDRPGPTMWERL